MQGGSVPSSRNCREVPVVSCSLPYLLRLREEGRGGGGGGSLWTPSPTAFQRQILFGNSKLEWKLSNVQIQSADDRDVLSGSYPTALDLSDDDARFLLSGTKMGRVAIYDLWEQERSDSNDRMQQQQMYPPVQQAQVATTVTSLQWYPTDTGIFLTATAQGNVSLWDTTSMVPLLTSEPFQYESSDLVSGCYSRPYCMHVSPFCLLAAVGYTGSSIVKLVDLKSGSTSHSLLRKFQPGVERGGITAVRWSPLHEHILASAAGAEGGPPLLWDIRRTTQPLTVLDAEERPDDPSLSTAFCADGSHYWKRQQKQQDRKQRSGSRPQQKQPSSSSSSRTTASNLVFDHTGHRLLTACGLRQEVAIWDLRYGNAPIKLSMGFVDQHNGKPVDRGLAQPLLWTGGWGHKKQEQRIWTVKGTTLLGYSLLDEDFGRPVHRLQGHLGHIQAVVTTDSPLNAPIITAASDGIILVWNRVKEDATTTSHDRRQRKRPRQQDVDSW